MMEIKWIKDFKERVAGLLSTPALKYLKLALLTLCLSSGLCLKDAQAALPVIDTSVLGQSIKQQVLSIEQWARDNLNQASQIEKLVTSNTLLTGTQDLMRSNYLMDSKQTWEQIRNLHQNSLALLYATKSIWEEFGSANQYYASFQKADAWKKCFHAGNCTFSTALNSLEESSISQAMQAHKNADEVTEQLAKQISSLQAIVTESQSTQSQAATLDALSKINGSVATSMIDLNAQIAQMIKLQSHELATNANKNVKSSAYFYEMSHGYQQDDANTSMSVYVGN